jgi:glucose-6-phosphate 1-dehydrogenase
MEEGGAPNIPSSDALVFFGATGDLAHKKIFPALQALAKRSNLDIPVIGVAKAGWTLDQLKARARDSVERYGGLHPDAFSRLSRRMDYIDGDYSDPATFQELRRKLGNAKRRRTISPSRRACSAPSFSGSASRVNLVAIILMGPDKRASECWTKVQ